MTEKEIKYLLKSHCSIENGKWVFKPIDIEAAVKELMGIMNRDNRA